MGLTIQVNNSNELCDLMCNNIIPQKEYARCLRCGRKLKSEENRQRGYGKICFEKLQVNQTNRLFTIK